MADLIQSLLGSASGEDVLLRLTFTLLILLGGHLAVKIVKLALKRIGTSGELNKKELEERYEAIQHIGYGLDGIVIIGALIYLNSEFTQNISDGIGTMIPDLFSAFLITLLGIITINIGLKLGRDAFSKLGFSSYLREIGLSRNAVDFVILLFKGFLYLLLLQIALSELGIGETFINEMITASSWAFAFLAAGLVFYGFKDLIRNFAAGIYLKNARLVRPGEEVNLQNERGEVREVSLFSTTVNTDTGHTLLTPNSKLMDSDIKFKRTKGDIETLEEIKSYFVAQNPAYCGPASLEMALEIFGYRHTQDEIGEEAGTTEGEGSEPDELMETVEKLTDGELKTAFVEYDNITDLGDEFKAWFNDGALIVPNFYKPAIFPDATTGHYVLSVGVEENELLVVDPSGTSGGVYYVDSEDMYEAMSEFDHSRGYIVIAPEGTTANWRIENNLIYSDKNYYEELSKTLEKRLRKILRQGSLLKNVSPSPIDDYMEDWRRDEKIKRLWRPESDLLNEDAE